MGGWKEGWWMSGREVSGLVGGREGGRWGRWEGGQLNLALKTTRASETSVKIVFL